MFVKIIKYTGLLLSFIVITGFFAYLTLHFLIKNQPEVVVPDLKGKDINYSISQLESMSLTPRLKNSQFSNIVTVNHIINQQPKPGEVVKKGRDVHLVISRGKKSNTMPFLSGESLNKAKIQILKNGLKLNHISYIYHSSVPEGHVIASSPQEGVFVDSGTDTNLLLSLGKRPREFVMPDIKGMTIEDATNKLGKVNLEVSDIKTRYSPDYEQGIVLSQTPPAGKKVGENERAVIVLNQRDVPSFISPVIGSRLVSYTVPPGVLKSHIKAELDLYDRTFTIYNDYFDPGKKILIAVPFDQNAGVKIYKDHKPVFEKEFFPFRNYKTDYTAFFDTELKINEEYLNE
ncbi:MAG: PASTA domain-containing protein [Thermodesulfobacteriota bacterium]